MVDNGPSKAFSQWAYRKNVRIHYSDRAKPPQNGFVESFNGKCRDECLSEHYFEDIEDAREKIEAWRIDYN